MEIGPHSLSGNFNADHARSGETPYIAVGAGIHIVLTAFLA
jgi:hypothetical protein